MKFRKKSVVIEAFQWLGACGPDSWPAWLKDANLLWTLGSLAGSYYLPAAIHIMTLEGVMIASPNDWIIKGVKGELYPCKPDIFEATYERVE